MQLRICSAIFLMFSVALASPHAHADDAKRALLKRAEPAYPPLARQMHLSGIVLLQISIEPDGHVSKVTSVSGHPLLLGAAEDAVRTWKYAAAQTSSEETVRIVFVAH